MIVSSPRLHRFHDDLVTKKGNYIELVCVNELEKHVEVPDSTGYWLEASDRQWPNRNGTRVKVKIGYYTPWYASDFTRGNWHELYSGLCPYLRKLGCKPGGPAKTIYFRLLYEE